MHWAHVFSGDQRAFVRLIFNKLLLPLNRIHPNPAEKQTNEISLVESGTSCVLTNDVMRCTLHACSEMSTPSVNVMHLKFSVFIFSWDLLRTLTKSINRHQFRLNFINWITITRRAMKTHNHETCTNAVLFRVMAFYLRHGIKPRLSEFITPAEVNDERWWRAKVA